MIFVERRILMRNESYKSTMVISIIIIPILFSCATTQQEQVECKDANTCHQLGLTHIQKGGFNQAILYFNKAIELDPTNPLFYSNRGAAYGVKGRNDLAVSDWTKALEINPKYGSAYYNRGRTFCVMKQYDKAISDLDKALEIDPKHARAYYERGIAYYEKGKYDLALSDFNKAQELGIKVPPYILNKLRKASGREK
jgi:Flp pilus assembly protein TadD